MPCFVPLPNDMTRAHSHPDHPEIHRGGNCFSRRLGRGKGNARGESGGNVTHSTAARINFVDLFIFSSPSVFGLLLSLNLMKIIDSKALKLPDSLIAALGAGETFALKGQSGLFAFLVPVHPPATKRPFGLAKWEFAGPDGFAKERSR